VGAVVLKRPKTDAEERRTFSDQLAKTASKIYVFFSIGFCMQIAQLRPEKISITGIELSVINADIIPGILFIICIALYGSLFGGTIISVIIFAHSNTNLLRHIVYVCAGKKKSLIAREKHHVYAVKKVARAIIKAMTSLYLVYLLLPLTFILLFGASSITKTALFLFSGQ
jgi:hypothetical protein